MDHNVNSGRPLSSETLPLKEVRAKLAERAGLINDNLIMLKAFEHTADAEHRKADLAATLREVGRWRLSGKGNLPVAPKIYMQYMWATFGEDAEGSIEQIIKRLVTDQPSLARNAATTAELASSIKSWHTSVSKFIDNETDPVDLAKRL